MFGLLQHRKFTEQQHFAVEVAAAVSRERLSQVHVDHALELIGLVAGRMTVMRALELYTAQHQLGSHEAAVARNRVLAAFEGAQQMPSPEPAVTAALEGNGAGRPAGDRVWVHRVREYLGVEERDDAGLADLLELASSRARAAVVNCHVENTLDFIRLLHGTLSRSDAASLYCEMVGLGSPWDEMVYCLSLERLSVERLPQLGVRAQAPESDLTKRRLQHPLRVVSSPA